MVSTRIMLMEKQRGLSQFHFILGQGILNYKD